MWLAMCHKFEKIPRPKHCAIARCEVYLSMYITYYSVSIPTPWAVAGPHRQLASIIMVLDMMYQTDAWRNRHYKTHNLPASSFEGHINKRGIDGDNITEQCLSLKLINVLGELPLIGEWNIDYRICCGDGALRSATE